MTMVANMELNKMRQQIRDLEVAIDVFTHNIKLQRIKNKMFKNKKKRLEKKLQQATTK
jgi:hypothetical protein